MLAIVASCSLITYSRKFPEFDWAPQIYIGALLVETKMKDLTLIFGVEVGEVVSTFRRKYDMSDAARNTTKKAETAVTSIIPAQPRSEARAYARWLRTEMSFQHYEDA